MDLNQAGADFFTSGPQNWLENVIEGLEQVDGEPPRTTKNHLETLYNHPKPLTNTNDLSKTVYNHPEPL